jgi:hypothetical protein
MSRSNADQPPAYGSQMQPNTNGAAYAMEIPPLPNGISLNKIYTDFLGYLHVRTREFFESNTPNGPAIWTRLAMNGRLLVILATPNGWDSSQQAFLRQAATDSGWIHNTVRDQHASFKFVTEGEASVHYALAHQNSNWLNKGVQFIVIDAGGSTVDSTLYECKQKFPKLVLEEVCASECVQVSFRSGMQLYSTFYFFYFVYLFDLYRQEECLSIEQHMLYSNRSFKRRNTVARNSYRR